jgi:iron(II)-dependent oxidoreductase
MHKVHGLKLGEAMLRFRFPLILTFILIFLPFVIQGNDLTDVGQIPDNMILIPAGEFVMGAEDEGDASPPHTVYIDSFYIDKYEVTNAEYEKFCDETETDLPEFWGMDEYHCGEDFLDYPVVGVNWYSASAYAKWCGKRLPTEAEWEYAARGGLVGKNYPFGDEIDTTLANYTFKGNRKGTMPVGSYQPNGYGLYDMSGNVNEWVSDYYNMDYYTTSPDSNPTGPEEGKHRMFRGGGWHTGPYCNRVFFRNALPPNWVDFNVGFRCVKDLHPKKEVEEGEE